MVALANTLVRQPWTPHPSMPMLRTESNRRATERNVDVLTQQACTRSPSIVKMYSRTCQWSAASNPELRIHSAAIAEPRGQDLSVVPYYHFSAENDGWKRNMHLTSGICSVPTGSPCSVTEPGKCSCVTHLFHLTSSLACNIKCKQLYFSIWVYKCLAQWSLMCTELWIVHSYERCKRWTFTLDP